jgi:beta-fructofuranosidase
MVTWRFVQFALRTGGNAPLRPPWGATESPFVVFYGGWYYLLMTYTDSELETYHNTLVFRSLNPFDFGEYTGDNEAEVVVAHLAAHAPEVVCDAEPDQWYITTCGWRGRGVPIEGAAAIAPLIWQPESVAG